tara:strand:- start:612 stop:968 length:357 start_codon:yes stop_codon:yes gene_type:complete
MKIKIKKLETYTITNSTGDFMFEIDEFRECTPAFIGSTAIEFMDYITNDIESMKDFLTINNDIICNSTKKYLYLLDVDPIYKTIQDSREDYKDVWFEMDPVKSEKEVDKISSSSKKVL